CFRLTFSSRGGRSQSPKARGAQTSSRRGSRCQTDFFLLVASLRLLEFWRWSRRRRVRHAYGNGGQAKFVGLRDCESRQDLQTLRRFLPVRDGRVDEIQPDSSGIFELGLVQSACGQEPAKLAPDFGGCRQRQGRTRF